MVDKNLCVSDRYLNHRVVFIVPYFGKTPSYFSLWLQSAEKNPDFDFLIYSDLPLSIESRSNVKQVQMSFSQIKERIERILKQKICLKTPYKLCDYKPMYGLIFEEDIKKYDFWGFIDIDLILGRLIDYITDEMFDLYDKLYYEGHFSLFRNCKLMNTLFMREYSNIIDWRYAFSTNYACHFDENGTVAWAHEIDPNCGIRFYNAWDFLDVPVDSYEILDGRTAGYAIWSDGVLKFFSFDGMQTRELMYIHLQKRKMNDFTTDSSKGFAVSRNSFYDLTVLNSNNYAEPEKDREKIKEFRAEKNRARRKQIVTNLMNGAIRFRICHRFNKWKSK